VFGWQFSARRFYRERDYGRQESRREGLKLAGLDKNAHWATVLFMKLEIEVPDSTMSALRRAPGELPGKICLMAAAKLYEVGDLSQERAAELAGLSRQDFVLALSEIGVSPFQGVEEDLVQASR